MAHFSTNWRGWWTTDCMPHHKSIAWENAISQSYCEWNLLKSVTDDFKAKIRQRAIGDIKLIEAKCGPCSGRRSLKNLSKEGGPYIGLQAVLDGSERFHIEGRSVEVVKGDLVLWNSHQNADFEISKNLHKITLLIPQSVLQSRLQLGSSILGGVINTSYGVGRLLFSHICELAHDFDTEYCDKGFGPKWATVELSAAASLSLQQPLVHAREDHLHHIQTFILHNLQDPNLSVASIAKDNSISTRYLHSLFTKTGTTVSRWILVQRLERCYDALAGRQKGRSVVKDVAFQWGFIDAAHFSRVFKKHYGISPHHHWTLTNNSE